MPHSSRFKANVNAKFAWIGLWHGVLFLALQGLMGPTYLVTLSGMAPILFNNITGATQSNFNILPIFATKIVVIGLLLVVSGQPGARLEEAPGKFRGTRSL